MDYELLKNKLIGHFGRDWSNKLSEKVECSQSLITQVFAGTKPDRKNIFKKGIDLLKSAEEEKEQQQLELKKIA